MSCEAARASLAAERYGGEAEAPAVRDAAHAHLASCAACQAFVAEARRLDALLALDPDGPPRPGFDTRFWARLAEHRPPRRRGLFWTIGAVTGAAALVLVLLSTGIPGPSFGDLEDVELAQDLELLEDLDVVRHLDELEAFELLAKVDLATLEGASPEVPQ